ncbi:MULTISPECIES: restriction endonuclease subunit S [Pseudomonas syringae group]|uniref:Type I restriction enzyme specificity protein HsdS n=1 Tax=Pseudomonas syringae pv. pisi TaxID=59510 RepID=A0A3M6DJ64_PSESJ|nr:MULTISPECIES: restriction endonuclease subunit S [Pseudomonas syringae group]PYD28459.1 restriction endonuclease subunit S [Pseudomonas syringae pv. pisi]RMO31419.1 Type I restriction enzyme specificity protein HsdS [Pseudomonas syringae pv. pisi]RMV55970.1 Type I restriction enzyme specificity protein HsdS [Pseudomonas syringae pv. pisi]RMV65154.1 Type I restriction enzyme specificity protein HsdS [Pseudomonas coronafaciens pv. atropurpurea]
MSSVCFLDKLLDGAGVEWLPLVKIAKIKHGKDWKGLQSGSIPVYGSGGIMGYVDKYSYNKPTVLIPRKGSITNIFYVDVPFWNVDTIYYTDIDYSRVIPKYLYYFMKTIDMMALDTGSGRPSLTQAILKEILIPIPCPDDSKKSLKIQAEIVRILNTFSELTAELTAKLKAELKARKKQYNYYRDQLLSFEGGKVEWKTLGEVAEIGTGSHDTQDAIEDGEYIFYARGRATLKLNVFDFDETAIITAGDGAGVGKVFHYAQGKYALHQRAYRIVPGKLMEPRFLYHCVASHFYEYIQKVSVSSSVTSLRRPMFLNFPIPVPSLTEQARIVATLDKFDTLTNSISEGLPRETELRQKQYEYYRELLLGFPKSKEVTA